MDYKQHIETLKEYLFFSRTKNWEFLNWCDDITRNVGCTTIISRLERMKKNLDFDVRRYLKDHHWIFFDDSFEEFITTIIKDYNLNILGTPVEVPNISEVKTEGDKVYVLYKQKLNEDFKYQPLLETVVNNSAEKVFLMQIYLAWKYDSD